jgi:PIN domain nuclease of toxin-antitoxin system
VIVLDTHIFVWFLSKDSKLSYEDVKKLNQAMQNEEIALSSISIWEIAMLHERNKIFLTQPFDAWIDEATENIKIINLNRAIASDSAQLPDCNHKDPADRFIISTARVYNAKLMTRDSKIIEYAKTGHVNLI